ncbi:hypothetical protein EKO04_002022 [Ascochyta lentis]|uniref:Uncharacterized protein n=1 Tax=Ascochyta lentis TaxID=205686 RepID=A0A8H7MHA7_9PLEO|nr:hypothetical protein EKO04_002022 [Ascochyta lentis]
MSHGRYSRTCCSALEQSFSTSYTHRHGPISGRTRSQTSQNTSLSKNQPTTPHPLPPSSGHFPRTRQITPTAQTRAEHKLRRSRLKLQNYLKSDRWQRDDVQDQDAREPTRGQIEQLGVLDAVGGIQTIPRARPGRWDSDVRMISKRARRRARPSRLREVECNYTEEELDGLFGLLPGEVQDGEMDLDAEMDVVEQLTEEGRVEEALWDGEKVEGVWRYVRDSGDGDEVAIVARWASACSVAWKWRVMDPHCIDVVKRVRGVKQD